MRTELDKKRIYIFVAFAFGIAWACALVIYLTGGLADSPVLVEGITLAFVLLATVYMGAPALAHILTRVVTKEGWQDTYLRPNFRRGWLFWLVAWFSPALFTFLGLLVYFLIFPQHYDPELRAVIELLQRSAETVGQALPEIDPWLIVLAQSAQAILIAPALNALPTLGEEFGWRAYLQPKLMPLGGRKAMLLMGLIWGIWHCPVILMGQNYGLEYPGAPWLGPLIMVWFTFVVGTLIGWVTLKGGSVWPAVIAHGALNGIANIGMFFIKGKPNPILGPLPVGLIGSIGFSLMALALFLIPAALETPETVPAD